jgi:hypothetical protein
VQNAVVHFWNSHLHLFRKGLGAHAMPEVTLNQIELELDEIYCSFDSKR